MANEWWTERMKAADDAFAAEDSEAVTRVLREMWEASGPQHVDQEQGVGDARERLRNAMLHVERGDLPWARKIYDKAIPYLTWTPPSDEAAPESPEAAS